MAPKKKEKDFEDINDNEIKKDGDVKNDVPIPTDKADTHDEVKDPAPPPLLQSLPKYFSSYAQLYRCLGERHRALPTFLKRNLPYMKSSRPPRRKNFKMEDLIKNCKESKRSQYLTLTFLGYYDADMPSGKKSTVRVETIIEKQYIDKLSKIKRKRILSQPVLAQIGTNEIPLNPDENDDRPVPILSIAPETISSSSNAVKVRCLLLRVVTNGSSEPYEIRYALCDNKGNVLMSEGDYQGDETVNVDNVWITIKDEMFESLSTCAPAKRTLRFNIKWTTDCKSGWVPRPKSPTWAVEPQPVVKPPPPVPQEEYTLSFEFLYSDGRQDTPADSSCVCPFCYMDYFRLYPLFKHLRNCHDRFNFSFNLEGKHIKVEVTCNEQADTSYEGNPYNFIKASQGVVTRRTSFTQELVSRPKRYRRPASYNLSEFFDQEDATDQLRPHTHGYNRQYYHSTTFMPITPAELDYDSEGERDPVWLQRKTKMMIDDFTDVNDGEKAIFKMWNHHVLKGGFVADCHIPLAVQTFVAENGRDILRRNLVVNFHLHLANLFDFGLLSPQQYREAMRMLNEQLRADPEALKIQGEAWLESRKSWLASGGIGGPRDKGSKGSAPSTSYEADESNDRKQNQSSTFISGDGTLKRKMAGAPRGKKGRPPGPGTSKSAVEDVDEDSEDEKLSTVRRTSVTSAPPMKKSVSVPVAGPSGLCNSVADRALRKRKLSLQDRTSNGDPVKRARAGSDPSRGKSLTTAEAKSPLRKSAAP